jgi:hypothetical protein
MFRNRPSSSVIFAMTKVFGWTMIMMSMMSANSFLLIRAWSPATIAVTTTTWSTRTFQAQLRQQQQHCPQARRRSTMVCRKMSQQESDDGISNDNNNNKQENSETLSSENDDNVYNMANRFSIFAPDTNLSQEEFRAQLKENMKADLERRRREDPNRGNQPAKSYLDSL